MHSPVCARSACLTFVLLFTGTRSRSGPGKRKTSVGSESSAGKLSRFTPLHTKNNEHSAEVLPKKDTQNKKLVKVGQKVGRNWSPCIKRKYWS